MQIAILGGGITGLTSAYYLAKKGHQVTLWEKETTLGGLASGFKNEGWNWYLDKTYHHLFANDHEILNLAKKIGFDRIFFQEPETASLYNRGEIGVAGGGYKIIPLDTPLDFIKFPLLDLPTKLRAGSVIAFLKLSPFFPFYEQMTAQAFLQGSMGNRAWDVLWQELFRKKFGNSAGNILASFIWARIKKRTKKLGYIEGGFQEFINHLEKVNRQLGVDIGKGEEIETVGKAGKKFKVGSGEFDALVSTLPTPILIEVAKEVLPHDYLNRLKKIQYLHSVDLIIESDMPLFSHAYWVNVCDSNIPIMGLVQHTNFIDKRFYNNKHILYVANYVGGDNLLLGMNDKQLLDYFLPYLKLINKTFNVKHLTSHIFKYAQPIFDKKFINNKPDFKTPVDNFYLANLDMTYPYDRGVNYAVSLARRIGEMI